MSVQDHSRWVELSAGVSTVTRTLYEALSYSQSYETVGGVVVHRMLDGTGVRQSNWSKLRTSLSGNGGMPLGFSGLDYTQVLTLKCGAQRAITSLSNVIVVPSEHRVDSGYLPVGRKRIEGLYEAAEVSVAGNTITVTTDAAADSYMVQYFPQIQVIMNDPAESFDWGDNSSSWSLTAEQI